MAANLFNRKPAGQDSADQMPVALELLQPYIGNKTSGWQYRMLVWGSHLFDCFVIVFGPLYVLGATTLIGTVAYVSFSAVLGQVNSPSISDWKWVHVVIGVFLLLNLLFNYFGCVFTSPGSTLDVSVEALQLDCPDHARYCRRCSRLKPPLAHHCHICKRCILRMDHHCPWVNNCVGYHNYKYFFLFLFYLWLSSAYAAVILFIAKDGQAVVSTIIGLHRLRRRYRYQFADLFSIVLSGACCCTLSILLGWHIYLVLSGQGTIDFYQNLDKRISASAVGEKFVNKYNLGMAKNWQDTFDVYGPLWWVRWLLPSCQKKRGNGIRYSTVESYKAAVLESHKPSVSYV